MKLRLFTILALSVAVGLAVAVSPYASSQPDGLLRVAIDQGFDGGGRTRGGPVPGYAFPGIGNERIAKGVAGFAGTLLVFGLGHGLAALRRRPGTPVRGPA